GLRRGSVHAELAPVHAAEPLLAGSARVAAEQLHAVGPAVDEGFVGHANGDAAFRASTDRFCTDATCCVSWSWASALLARIIGATLRGPASSSLSLRACRRSRRCARWRPAHAAGLRRHTAPRRSRRSPRVVQT